MTTSSLKGYCYRAMLKRITNYQKLILDYIGLMALDQPSTLSCISKLWDRPGICQLFYTILKYKLTPEFGNCFAFILENFTWSQKYFTQVSPVTNSTSTPRRSSMARNPPTGNLKSTICTRGGGVNASRKYFTIFRHFKEWPLYLISQSIKFFWTLLLHPPNTKTLVCESSIYMYVCNGCMSVVVNMHLIWFEKYESFGCWRGFKCKSLKVCFMADFCIST